MESREMKLQPQYRWKRNLKKLGALALIPLVVTTLLLTRNVTNKPEVLEPPYPGATLIGELTERDSSEQEQSYNTGNYTLLNDGKQGFDDIVLVLALWNYGDAPDSFALKPGESWKVEKTIAQNWHGRLILWQMPPDPTPTPMPTIQLGDPCTLSFITCPETPVP